MYSTARHNEPSLRDLICTRHFNAGCGPAVRSGFSGLPVSGRSVIDFFKEQAVRGGGFDDVGPSLLLEDLPEAIRWKLAEPDIHEATDQAADHFIEEPGRFRGDGDTLATANDGQYSQIFNRVLFFLAAGCGEGSKIVASLQQAGRFVHRFH